ncbi:MAG: hypothetical protein R3B47_00435 [Bacteroidia bacterium]
MNTTLQVRFSILNQGRIGLQALYTETHANVTTDAYGQFSLPVGMGTPSLGTFAGLNWDSQGDSYLQVEINQGAGYVNMGSVQLLSVPFAQHSQTADKAVNLNMDELADVNASLPANGDVLSYNLSLGTWQSGPPQWAGGGYWTQNGSNIYFNSGNVSIGGTNPSCKLSIHQGDQCFTHAFATSSADLISLYGNRIGLQAMVGFGFETEAVQVGPQLLTERLLYSRSEGGFRWYLNELANGGGNATMAIDRNGRLGLGTHTPDANLHIYDYTDMTNSNLTGSLMIGQTSWIHLTMDRDEIQARNTNGVPSVMHLQRRGGDLTLVAGNGDVGLGTENPQARLHINNGYDVTLSQAGYLLLGETNGLNVTMDNNEIMARNAGGTANLYLQLNGGGVSIGTTTVPTGYLFSVDGKIISEGLRCEISGSWPDYVFDKNYELMPLLEVDEFIQENGHLPGMPAAAVVESEGLDVDEMQVKMMEKIEELTLHMIRLEKENHELRARLEKIENQ